MHEIKNFVVNIIKIITYNTYWQFNKEKIINKMSKISNNKKKDNHFNESKNRF